MPGTALRVQDIHTDTWNIGSLADRGEGDPEAAGTAGVGGEKTSQVPAIRK